jgi:pyruvate dehydrogenase E2 component (dihydrolipoamide acetyltransferase)
LAQIIEMPKLSDTMEEGGIANWLKKEGETVDIGEPLVEIETDKATQEYESPEDGVLLKIIVQPGKTVALRTPIAVIGAKGESFDLEALLKGKGAPAGKKVEAPTKEKLDGPAVAAKATSTSKPAVTNKPSAEAAQAPNASGRVRSSPLARKVAEELGVAIENIAGSGPGGRVVMKDVQEAKSSGSSSPAASKGSASPAQGGADATVMPVSMMRKTIAKRLLAAKNDAPHFYLTVSANMEHLNAWRTRLNDDAAKSDGKLAKTSVNDLMILGVARALRQHPVVNSSWQGDHILQHNQVHVALAVALPDGLVTPVIRNTDHLGVREIARQSRDLATKAKDGKLSNNDYAGGTFTISNLGMFGIEEFTAIINPPQAAILAIGAATPTPWVDASGNLVVQTRVKMTMSCDHRVVDGASGAAFLKTLVAYLEDPLSMMA